MTTHAHTMDQALIDLRSDTVTRPTPGMHDAMRRAEVGDDVLGDDPTVIELQRTVAALLGKEAALFVPSGTMANLLATRAQTRPGDEIIMHESSHVYAYEAGGYAAINGCSFAAIRSGDGTFGPDDVRAVIRPDDAHFPPSTLLVVENTHNKGGGTVWPHDLALRVTDAARSLGLRCHLDGARLWNAAVAGGLSPAQLASPFDSVSVCFSKGLGAPVGSAIVGSADTIARCHRARKMLGGAMRQAGLLAAAALFALDNNLDRLADDHRNAQRLARGLQTIAGVGVDPAAVHTNIVYFDLAPALPAASSLCAAARDHGLLILPAGARSVRAVCHLDVGEEDIDRAVEIIARVASPRATQT